MENTRTAHPLNLPYTAVHHYTEQQLPDAVEAGLTYTNQQSARATCHLVLT